MTTTTKEITINLGWHKANDRITMTYSQLQYIESLTNDSNCPDWPFSSSTNAMRQLTKFDASEMIDALKNGYTIRFK